MPDRSQFESLYNAMKQREKRTTMEPMSGLTTFTPLEVGVGLTLTSPLERANGITTFSPLEKNNGTTTITPYEQHTGQVYSSPWDRTGPGRNYAFMPNKDEDEFNDNLYWIMITKGEKEAARAYYTPGKEVPSYGGGTDTVLAFYDSPNNPWDDVSSWDVVVKDSTTGEVRKHRTPPQDIWNDLDKIIDRPSPQSYIQYTREGLADDFERAAFDEALHNITFDKHINDPRPTIGDVDIAQSAAYGRSREQEKLNANNPSMVYKQLYETLLEDNPEQAAIFRALVQYDFPELFSDNPPTVDSGMNSMGGGLIQRLENSFWHMKGLGPKLEDPLADLQQEDTPRGEVVNPELRKALGLDPIQIEPSPEEVEAQKMLDYNKDFSYGTPDWTPPKDEYYLDDKPDEVPWRFDPVRGFVQD